MLQGCIENGNASQTRSLAGAEVSECIRNTRPVLPLAKFRRLASRRALTTVVASTRPPRSRSREVKPNLRDSLPEFKNGMGSQQDSTQPKVVPLKLEQDALVAAGGFPVLGGIGSHVSARKVDGLDTALLLGVTAPKAVSRLDVKLGELKCSRFLACARIKLWWMTPEWGSKASELPPETQFLLLRLANGPFAVVLPLIDNGRFRCTLRPPRKGDDDDDLRLRIESGDKAVISKNWNSAVIVAAGYDPFHLVDLAVAAGARLSGGSKPRVDKVVPEFVNYFGWCTWDAFYSTVSAKGKPSARPLCLRTLPARKQGLRWGAGFDPSEMPVTLRYIDFSAPEAAQGVEQGLESLTKGDVPPKFLIIDDGWQQTGPDDKNARISSSRLEAKRDTLQNMGAGGSYPINKLQATRRDSRFRYQFWPSDLFERAIGRFQAVVEVCLCGFYKDYIENAPEGSWRIAYFAALTRGPLRSFLINYYALTSDHTQRLLSVRANGKFSDPKATSETPLSRREDLKHVVSELRKQFGIKFVYAWHSLHGYWAGIKTGNTETMPYNGKLVMPRPTPGVLEIDPCFAWSQQVVAGVGVAEDVRKLYGDMHTYLAGAGVDGVKVDCQAILGMVGGGFPGLGGGPALAAEYHRALEASVERHFPGNNCINCMCHSTDDLYRMESTSVARSSDDFWPTDPASHTTHIAVNAYNSLFMGAILQPDWDMFHSQHPAALLHATARVISGGPIYVSDKPGRHDIPLLKRLVRSDGSLLRCVGVGRPTLDCLFADVMRDSTSILKVWNMNLCNGVLASFNLQGASWSRRMRKYLTHNRTPSTLSATVSPSDVPPFKRNLKVTKYPGQDIPELYHLVVNNQLKDLPFSSRFAVYSDNQRKLWLLASWERVLVLLKPGQSDLFTVAPLQSNGHVDFAPIGLTNMLNAGGAILEWNAAEIASDSEFRFKVKGIGKLLAYSSRKPKQVLVNNKKADFSYSSNDGSVTVVIAAEGSDVAVRA